jgi:hypothetical protein
MLVYTVITRTDCPFPEQDYIHPKFKYVCLHSVDVPKRKGWEYIKIKEEESDRYTYTKYKILSHEMFQEDCIVIDGKNILTNIFYNEYEKDIKNCDSLLQAHSDCRYMFDELVEWLLYPVITYEEALDIIDFHIKEDYNFKTQEPVLTAFHYRKYNNKTIEHNKLWWKYWLKYKKRDQLWWYLSRYKINNQINWAFKQYVYSLKHQPTDGNKPLKLINLNKLKDLVRYIKDNTDIDYKINQWVLNHRI